MTVPASSVAGVKAYLVSHITSQVNDPTVLVSYDAPGPDQPDDLVVVGDVRRHVDIAAMIGSGQAGWLDETYDVEVSISVFRGSDLAQTVFERACALCDAVEAVVRNDPSLGSKVLVAHGAEAEYRCDWDDQHRGRLCEITLAVHCSTRL